MIHTKITPMKNALLRRKHMRQRANTPTFFQQLPHCLASEAFLALHVAIIETERSCGHLTRLTCIKLSSKQWMTTANLAHHLYLLATHYGFHWYITPRSWTHDHCVSFAVKIFRYCKCLLRESETIFCEVRRSGLPVWLFLGQICHFWPFLNSSAFFLLLKKRPFLVSYIFMSIWQIKHDFCRFLGIGRFLDTVSGHRTINCYWKLCMRIHDFLCCCFNPVCSFRLLFSKTKRFEKLINGVSFIVFMYKICRLYIAFQKHVWVFSWWCCVFILDFWCYLAFLRVYLAFFAYGYLAPWRQFPWVNAREEQVDIAFICSHSLCLETYTELRIVVQFAFALSLL